MLATSNSASSGITSISDGQAVGPYTRFLFGYNQNNGGGSTGRSATRSMLNPHRHHTFSENVQSHRWRFVSVSARSFWTKYCLLCTICGSAATILAGIFLVVAALFRYYTTSIYYFETIPTYIPAILLSICGVSTIAFSCKRNRNIILLRITACWSLVSAALSSVITITTSLIHMNRLQTLRECVYNGKPNPPSCTCIAHTLNIDSTDYEPVHYVFENTPDCDVIHGTLYSCLRAVFAISVVAVLLSIFLCMLLYQLIGHERKKAYWSRIRRINSDWSTDFIACLARPVPREPSSMLPLVMSPTTITLPVSVNGPGMLHPNQGPYGWGPPPPYEDLRPGRGGIRGVAGGSEQELQHPSSSTCNNNNGNLARRTASITFPTPGSRDAPTGSNNHNNGGGNKLQQSLEFPIISAHPFSPTITSMDPRYDHHLAPGEGGRPGGSGLNNGNNGEGPTGNPPEDKITARLLQMQINPPTHSTLPHNFVLLGDSKCELPPGDSSGSSGEGLDPAGGMLDKCGEIREKCGEIREKSGGPGLPRKDGISNKNLSGHLQKIHSLPNSPILKNFRRFYSFRFGDSGGGNKEDGRVFESSARLNHCFHTSDFLRDDRESCGRPEPMRSERVGSTESSQLLRHMSEDGNCCPSGDSDTIYKVIV